MNTDDKKLKDNLRYAIKTLLIHTNIRGFDEDDPSPYILFTKAFRDAGWQPPVNTDDKKEPTLQEKMDKALKNYDNPVVNIKWASNTDDIDKQLSEIVDSLVKQNGSELMKDRLAHPSVNDAKQSLHQLIQEETYNVVKSMLIDTKQFDDAIISEPESKDSLLDQKR